MERNIKTNLNRSMVHKEADKRFIITALIVVAFTIFSTLSILNYNLNKYNDNFEKQMQRINRININPTNIKLIECIESINIYDADKDYTTNLDLSNITNSDECTQTINVTFNSYSFLENNKENTTTIIITKQIKSVRINQEL